MIVIRWWVIVLYSLYFSTAYSLQSGYKLLVLNLYLQYTIQLATLEPLDKLCSTKAMLNSCKDLVCVSYFMCNCNLIVLGVTCIPQWIHNTVIVHIWQGHMMKSSFANSYVEYQQCNMILMYIYIAKLKGVWWLANKTPHLQCKSIPWCIQYSLNHIASVLTRQKIK